GEEAGAAAVGKRQGPLHDEGQVRGGDGARHVVADRRLQDRYAGVRPPRRGRRALVRARTDGPGDGRPHLLRALEEAGEEEAVSRAARAPDAAPLAEERVAALARAP